MSTNQEGKHTPEQILEREAGEIFPLHSYPGNSIEGGKLYKQLQKAYIAGGHSILASQSSELSKLREENERLSKELWGKNEAIKTHVMLHDQGSHLIQDLQQSLTEREAEIERLKLALNMIMELEPETHDEWGEAACFTQAQDIANVALGLSKSKPTE